MNLNSNHRRNNYKIYKDEMNKTTHFKIINVEFN